MTNLVKLDYFYDNTMKRFIDQVVRAFSGWQYMSYPQGNPTLNVIPCSTSLSNTIVAALINKSSAVMLPSLPAISVTHIGVEERRQDLKNTTFIRSVQVTERKLDGTTYTSEEGRSSTIRNMMPRPLTMTFQVDIWVSNQDQKYQIWEQLFPIFYPAIQIQNSDNPLDWSAETQLICTGMSWSSRQLPIGTDNSGIDYATLNYELPIWLNLPSEVTQRRRIEQIVQNVYTNGGTDEDVLVDSFTNHPDLQVITTPGDHQIMVSGSSIILLSHLGGMFDHNAQIYDWAKLVKLYGSMKPGTSSIRLKTSSNIDDTATDIVGTIQYDPDAFNKLIWTLDHSTLPTDTVPAVAGIIVDPHKVWPGQGLPGQTIGQRYLLQGAVSTHTQWGSITAPANSIIQFDGSHWTVDYQPTINVVGGYVTSSASGRQLRWDGQDWVFTFDGVYAPGHWRIVI